MSNVGLSEILSPICCRVCVVTSWGRLVGVCVNNQLYSRSKWISATQMLMSIVWEYGYVRASCLCLSEFLVR